MLVNHKWSFLISRSWIRFPAGNTLGKSSRDSAVVVGACWCIKYSVVQCRALYPCITGRCVQTTEIQDLNKLEWKNLSEHQHYEIFRFWTDCRTSDVAWLEDAQVHCSLTCLCYTLYWRCPLCLMRNRRSLVVKWCSKLLMKKNRKSNSIDAQFTARSIRIDQISCNPNETVPLLNFLFIAKVSKMSFHWHPACLLTKLTTFCLIRWYIIWRYTFLNGQAFSCQQETYQHWNWAYWHVLFSLSTNDTLKPLRLLAWKVDL